MRLPLALALTGILVMCSTGDAQAQSHMVRSGFVGGVGVGVGTLRADCSDCSSTMEAGGLHAHIGGMVAPILAIVGELWVMAHTEGRLTVWQNLATVGAQIFVSPIFWLKAGVGAATAGYQWESQFVTFEDRTRTVLGVVLGVGVEVYHAGRFAIDIQARYGTGFYSDEPGYTANGHSFQIGVGFNWY